MNECQRTAERIAAYVDASLPPEECADVERHLAGCPPCRAAASDERTAYDVLRARADRLRAHPLPPGLRSRCEAIVREPASAPAATWHGRLVPVALIALLLVFTGTAILSLATQRSAGLLAAQLTADHFKCFKAFAPVDAPGVDAGAVEAMLAAEYGWNVHVPPSDETGGLRLIGARQCLYADGHLPHIMYRANGQDLSLFVLEGVERADAEVTALGHRSRIWTRGATTFVLVAPAEEADGLADAERYVMLEAH